MSMARRGTGAKARVRPPRAAMPPLADAFTWREELPDISRLLAPGAVVALVPAGPAGEDESGGSGSCGKTQLASQAAGLLWEAGAVDLLAWVPASSRASVLSGYARMAAGLGLDHGDAELIAARLLAWLASARRPWLIVLDDLRDGADIAGLWPAGAAGRVLVTAADTAVFAGGPPARQVPVPALTLREAMGFLSARLTEDPGQRNGAIDLAGLTSGDPAALAMAAAVIAETGVSCRDYLHWYMQRMGQLAAARAPSSPADIAWTLCADLAGQLTPAGGTWPLLVLAALLDGTGIPAIIFTTSAVRGFLADPGPAPGEMQAMVRALARAGLITLDLTEPADPVVRMNGYVQRAVLAAAKPGLAGRAARAAADALVQAWPDEQPHSWLAAALRSSAAQLRRSAGDALWAEGCHPLLPEAGRGLEDAGMPGPAACWWRAVAGDATRLLAPSTPPPWRRPAGWPRYWSRPENRPRRWRGRRARRPAWPGSGVLMTRLRSRRRSPQAAAWLRRARPVTRQPSWTRRSGSASRRTAPMTPGRWRPVMSTPSR